MASTKDAPKPLEVRVQKAQERFRRVKVPHGPDLGFGEFFLLIDVTALTDTLYIPLSIATSKKTTGFVYHFEGTAQATVAKNTIASSGDGVTQITLGTILYVKIPAGSTATFRILIEMRGRVPKEYRLVIHQMHYKRKPSDARYEKLEVELGTDILKFR